MWHNLNCKGRFAGEIRIELTYYDIRPKEEKATEKPQDALTNTLKDEKREPMSGPRQPKPITRRPLPANPTASTSTRSALIEHPRSSPVNQISSSNSHYMSSPQPQFIPRIPDSRIVPSSTSTPQHQQYSNVDDQISANSYRTYGREMPDEMHSMAPYLDQDLPNNLSMQNPVDVQDNGNSHSREWHLESQQGREFDAPLQYEMSEQTASAKQLYGSHIKSQQYYNHAYSDSEARPRKLEPHREDTYDTPTASESPFISQRHRIIGEQPQPLSQSFEMPGYEYSAPANVGEDQLPRRQPPRNTSEAWPNPSQTRMVDEGTPPPPPVHRSSILRPSSHTGENNVTHGYSSVPGPAGLSIRNERGSTSASPLSQSLISTSPSASLPHPISAISYPPHTSYTQTPRRESNDSSFNSPPKDYSHALPSSLIPGIEPSAAEDEARRLLDEKVSAPSHSYVLEPLTQSYSLPSYPTHSSAYSSPQTIESSTIHKQDAPQHGRTHRSSVPIVRPRMAGPDPRTPVRKSVSPQPEKPTDGRRTSAIPFSPDSYDAFNPSLSAASSVNSSGPRYNTPDQAREALREYEKEVKLNEGPIIGDDGRVIDPSDHLPSDTWAPEPETKPPRKGPEITLRFRHSPQGAQPMPPAARRPLHDRPNRPHSVSTPVYAYNPDCSPTNAGNRVRLQKKPRGSPAQPASSPIVPTVHTGMPRAPVTSSSVMDSPLREHDNYDHNSRSIRASDSPTNGVPPPIPMKIPISVRRDEENWEPSALSEEMSRIDIGTGGGSGRIRRSRFGG